MNPNYVSAETASAEEAFSLRTETEEDALRFILAGRLDSLSAPQFLNAWEEKKTSGEICRVEIDCADLQYISSAGLRVLIIIRKDVPDASMVLKGVNSTVEEILENAAGFRQRGLPLDVIVQDWQWWGDTGWNSMVFDPVHYPNPRALTDSLHSQDVRFMLSVWSKVDRSTKLGQQLADKGYYIGETDWIDFFNKDAADFYVRSFRDSLAVPYGIDAWWFDATEPENDDLAGRLVGQDQIPGEFYRNVYPLMVNRTMYNGLKSLTGQPPVILTRSAFPGIQRYGVVTWSGDVGNDLETLRRQVAGGLGQMASGLPWWTFDAGGFFRPGEQYTSAEYQERLIRWVQVATFLPFMRVHGYMSETEPWRYGEETCAILASFMELREKLRPYILACARRVSKDGYTLMRPLVFDFPEDADAVQREGEFLFGPALLVNPVTEAGAQLWTTYLPQNADGWTDFWTGEHYEGGQWIQTDVDLRTLPVFVRNSDLTNLLPL